MRRLRASERASAPCPVPGEPGIGSPAKVRPGPIWAYRESAGPRREAQAPGPGLGPSRRPGSGLPLAKSASRHRRRRWQAPKVGLGGQGRMPAFHPAGAECRLLEMALGSSEMAQTPFITLNSLRLTGSSLGPRISPVLTPKQSGCEVVQRPGFCCAARRPVDGCEPWDSSDANCPAGMPMVAI